MTALKTRTMRLGWAACVAGALVFAAGCGGSDELLDGDGAPIGDQDADNGNGNGNNGNGNGNNGNGNGDIDGGANGNGNGESFTCEGDTQCSDGIDNDGDDLVDLADPNCASCFDNDESSFATGIPGDNKSNDGTQDCFFDGNTGSGNDGCRIPDCCYDLNDNECEMGDATCDAAFTDECIENCAPAAPPGCDCGGCCTICNPDTGECADIFRGADFENDFPDCDVDNFDACPTCVKNDDCGGPECKDNECVICAGQDEDDRGDTCDGEDSCPGGTACSSNDDCDSGQYCGLGCCLNEID